MGGGKLGDFFKVIEVFEGATLCSLKMGVSAGRHCFDQGLSEGEISSYAPSTSRDDHVKVGPVGEACPVILFELF